MRMNPREKREAQEKLILSPYAVCACNTKGRLVFEEEGNIRTAFQRDVDRIIHSKSFRRLKHKTQVFLSPEGDHYRTRLTHTLEVTRIARTIARGLELNEDLTEAIALGHDLGHTPFGHAGERALNVIMKNDGGFRHYEQSLRIVDKLEKDGEGLNLTYEVRNGIVRHTNDPLADTLEGRIVRLSDKIAYVNHDVDDSVRAGILSEEDIPEEIKSILGFRYSERINTLVEDVINESTDKNEILQSPAAYFALDSFYSFLYENVYVNPKAKSEEAKVLDMLSGIFEYYMKHLDMLPDDYKHLIESDGEKRAICDYISGMTDKYAIDKFTELFIPAPWQTI